MTKNKRKNRKKNRQNKQSFQTITAGVVLVILSTVWLANQGNGGLRRDINVDQAYQLREEGAFILDVREPSEWNEKHIPGSTLIPLGQLSSRVNELPQDQTIVVICRSGNRSQTGRDILLDAGFEDVTSTTGGINDWIASGYEYVTGP